MFSMLPEESLVRRFHPVGEPAPDMTKFTRETHPYDLVSQEPLPGPHSVITWGSLDEKEPIR